MAAGAVALLSVPGAGLFWLQPAKTTIAAEKMSVLNTFAFMTFPLNVSAARVCASRRAAPDGRERTKPKAVDKKTTASPRFNCCGRQQTANKRRQRTTPRTGIPHPRRCMFRRNYGRLRSRCRSRRRSVRVRSRSRSVLIRGWSRWSWLSWRRRGSGVLIRRSRRGAVLVARDKESRGRKRGKYFQRLHLVTPMQAKMEMPYSGLETLD